MGIELEREKITDDVNNSIAKFFLPLFNSDLKLKKFRTLQLKIKKINNPNIDALKTESRNLIVLKEAAYNFECISLLPKKKENDPKRLLLVKLIERFGNTLRAGLIPSFTSIIISLSLLKRSILHSCKNFFVHLLEKSNLLMRSDNNTEFSSRKVLQTTTI